MGLLLSINGCFFIETQDGTDRRIAYARAAEVLEGGGSLTILPEDARNGTENIPSGPCSKARRGWRWRPAWGVVSAGIERYDERFVIKFGQELRPEDFGCHIELTRALRDALATLKWDIWENKGLQSRSALADDYGKRFIEDFVQRIAPWDTLETIESTRFRSQAKMGQREVLAHLDRTVPGKNGELLEV